ncbi:MAG: O-antigen ligase family protein [Flavobacteriales bacterium]|nr:O-antigen ligase family protein [Flavobacteriales bacterium]
MIDKLSIRWFYGLGFVFLTILLAAIYFDLLFIVILPLIPVFIWLLLYKTKDLLMFTVFAVPLSIPVSDVGGGLGMSFPTEPIIILVFIGLMLMLLNGYTFKNRFLFSVLSLIIGLDLFWNLIAAIYSSMPFVSFKFVLSRFWYIMIFYFLFSNIFTDIKNIKRFIWLLAISIFLLASYTIYEHSKGSFTRGFAYAAMQPFLPDHGMYGALVAFIIPPLFVFAVWGFQLKVRQGLRILAFFMVAFLTLAVILSFTRAAWISLIGSAALIVAILLRIRFWNILLGLGVLLSIYFILQTDIQTQLSRNKQGSDDDIEEHVSSITNVSTDPSNLERLNRWRCAYRMYLERPVTGWGPGTYVFQYAPFQVSSELTIISTHSGDLGNVHSEFLRPLCESGLPGALIWVFLVFYSIYLGFRVFRNGESNEVRFLALALVSGLVTYFIHGLLNNYSEFDKLAVPMWGFLSALVALNTFTYSHDLEKV